ncbi:MAG: Lrp/AsnC family transcriptional regulator, partial [Promethearchaeota archaeon]
HPYVYWYSPTYGKFNGYLIHSVFSTITPNPNLLYLQELKNEGLISNYFIFDVLDFTVKNINLNQFDPIKGWVWDWNIWRAAFHEKLSSSPSTTLSLDENPEVVSFDYNDVKLLKYIRENSKITLKQLGELLDLSETQISRKIKRLEKEGIIKGYKSIFTPFPQNDLLFFYLFTEFKSNVEKILSWLYELPFNFDLLSESQGKYCLRFNFSVVDFKEFLRGLDLFKPFLSYFFLQFVYHDTSARLNPYNLFNKETNQWDTPIVKWREY